MNNFSGLARFLMASVDIPARLLHRMAANPVPLAPAVQGPRGSFAAPSPSPLAPLGAAPTHGAGGPEPSPTRFRPRASGSVLVVAPQPFIEDRGTPLAVSQVVRALSRLGYSVDVLTYPLGRALEAPGVRLVRIPNPFRFRSVPVGLSVRKLVLDMLLVPAIWWRLRTREYTCVHAVEEAAFPAAYFARSRSIPVIYDMQSSLPEQLTKYRVLRTGPAQAVLRRCERWLLKRVQWVISSSGLAELVHGSAPETSVREWAFVGDPAIPSAAEVARLRTELGIGPNTRVVLYTGTFEEYQGLPTLLSAVPLVRSAVPETLFVLVGARGADPLPVAERYGYEAVRILPRQPRERIPAFLALADVVVSPRAYGGNIPLKIFDYLAAGRPIVATDLPTHRSILNEDRAELVPATARGFAEAIVRLLQDPDRARRLADAGSAYAREHLSWDRFEKTVQEVYESACEAVPRPEEAA